MKQIRRRSMLLLSTVLLLATVGVAWAGVYKGLYKLVWSQDKEVCSAILNLFNTDMKEHGEIRYDQHKIFAEWKPMALPDDASPLHCGSVMKATLDMNNDGTEDMVIKKVFCFHGMDSDGLFIFPAGSDIATKLTWANIRDLLFNVPDKVDFDDYELKHWPKSKTDKFPTILGQPLVLEPLVWQGTTYLSMTERYSNYWIAIVKYRGGQVLEDICYFGTASSKKS